MKVRCGTDAATVSRIRQAVERGGDRFLHRVFTERELAYCQTRGRGMYASLAARFAAKEAVAKALGTGFGRSVSPVDVEVLTDDTGAPEALLHGGALRQFMNLGGQDLSVSLSHERDLALAFCVLLCDRPEEDREL